MMNCQSKGLTMNEADVLNIISKQIACLQCVKTVINIYISTYMYMYDWL